jgi:hypothetical protein
MRHYADPAFHRKAGAGSAVRTGFGLFWRTRRRDREAEGAPLLREYLPKANRGFESHRLRQDRLFRRFLSDKWAGCFWWFDVPYGNCTAMQCRFQCRFGPGYAVIEVETFNGHSGHRGPRQVRPTPDQKFSPTALVECGDSFRYRHRIGSIFGMAVREKEATYDVPVVYSISRR